MPYILPDGLSQATLLLLFLIIRYVGSIANSFYTPAYQATLYNLTPNTNERNKLIAADTYVDLFGVWLPSLFPFFVDYLPRTIPTKNIYLGGAIIFIALVIVFRVFGFFSLRERVPLASREEMNSTSVWKSVKQVASCRPMWALMAKNFFGMGKGTGQSVANYFWLNCTGKLSNAAIAGLFTGLPSYFVLPFATKMTKKLGLRRLSVFAYGYCGIVYLIMYFVGYKPTDNNLINIIIIVFFLTLAGAMNSIQRYCGTALQGDLYDYVEWKTGIRNEGMMSAAMGYITLITNNISTILSGLIVAAIHYEPLINSYGVVVPQTDPGMLQAIWTVFTLAPAIGRIGKAISLSFFNVDGKVKEQMMEDLAVTRAAKLKGRTDNEE
jgi:Na+/melibiose symporter-like transporter